jgi:hypothetical protein
MLLRQSVVVDDEAFRGYEGVAADLKSVSSSKPGSVGLHYPTLSRWMK